MSSLPEASDPLVLRVGPDLAFELAGLPAALRGRIADFLGYFVRPGERPPRGLAPTLPWAGAHPTVGWRPDEALRITADPPPKGTETAGAPLFQEPPLEVRQSGGITFFDVPGVRGWCDPVAGRGGIVPLGGPRGDNTVVCDRASDRALEELTRMALPAMLFELAQGRGWLGLHAAAVESCGGGILLPGASGAGKSTIFHDAHRSGLGVLSDDLVWVQETAAGFRLWAFPRHLPQVPVPEPTADNVPLRAIVCPVITAERDSRLVALSVPEVLAVLSAQSGFLTAGPLVGERFKALVRVARSAPGYRLEAGSAREQVPPMLAESARDPDGRGCQRTNAPSHW